MTLYAPLQGKVLQYCYHNAINLIMEQAIIRKLKDGTLAPYRAVAKIKGRSLEAELRDLIERSIPVLRPDPVSRLALARKLQSKTLKSDGDSTAFLRWSRDTNAGRIPGSAAFDDHDASD